MEGLSAGPVEKHAHLYVDLCHELVTLDGETVRLTPMEYQLFALLVKRPGVVVPRPVLVMQLDGYSPEIGRWKVDVHIHGLRRKLGIYAQQYIETVFGVGYRFRPTLPRS
jgi:DNA-binding response OmpR family regulator